jgi:hypothetical protein
MSQNIINQFAIINDNCITCYDYQNLVTKLALDINLKEKMYDEYLNDVSQLHYQIFRVSNPIVKQNKYVTYQESTKTIDFEKLNHDISTKLKNKDFSSNNWTVSELKIPSQIKHTQYQIERRKSHSNQHLKIGRVNHAGLYSYCKYWIRCNDVMNEPILEKIDKKVIKHQRRYTKQKLEWFDEWETYTGKKSTGWKNTKRKHQYKN